MKKLHTQKGLTLVEIMIAMVLSIGLLGGVIQIFTATKQSYRIQDALSRIQENGRFAIQILSSDLQMAGFLGCNGGSQFTNKLNSTNILEYNFEETIRGYDNLATTSADATYLSNAGITPDADTDIIVVRRPDTEPFRTTAPTISSEVYMEVASTVTNGCSGTSDQINGFCPGDFMMISDCEKSIVFQAGALSVSGSTATITHPQTSGTPGNNDATWGGSGAFSELFNADANTEIYKLSTVVYFIQTVTGIPSLFQYANGTTQALVEGVQDLQIQYGEDTSGDNVANIYRNADTVADWGNIVSAQLNFLVRSKENNMTENALGYTFNGAAVAAGDMPSDDRYIRRGFTTAITMRNHAS